MMKNDYIIRDVLLEDAKRIMEIYNYYIEYTTVTFRSKLKTLKDIEKMITDNIPTYGWYVIEINNIVVGYSRGNTFRDGEGYSVTCETSVYIDKEYLKKGYGILLYGKLLENLKKNKVKNAVAMLCTENDKSVKLHKNFGFKLNTILKDIGVKFDKTLSVAIYIKTLL